MIYWKALLCVLNFSKNRFDFIPGLLFSASIQIPESSAKHGTSNIFKPKDVFPFANITFNLNSDEIIIPQSALSKEYFENIKPIIKNKYITFTNYDTIEPSKTVPYSKELSYEEFDKPSIKINSKKQLKIPKKSKTKKIKIIKSEAKKANKS